MPEGIWVATKAKKKEHGEAERELYDPMYIR
jgi:hypothetical protein